MRLTKSDAEMLTAMRFAITVFLDWNDAHYQKGEPFLVPPASLSHMSLVALSQRIDQVLIQELKKSEGGADSNTP